MIVKTLLGLDLGYSDSYEFNSYETFGSLRTFLTKIKKVVGFFEKRDVM